MTLSQKATRTLKVLDYLFFRLLPGAAFLYVAGKIFFGVDSTLRASQSPWLWPFVALEMFTIVSLLVWVLVGDEVYKQRTKKYQEEAAKKSQFIKHLIGFAINCALVFYFTPKGELLLSLAYAGAVYTLGSFLLEMFLVLPSEFMRSVDKDGKTGERNILLGLFGIIAYILPLVWVSLKMATEFFHPGLLYISIIFVVISRLK